MSKPVRVGDWFYEPARGHLLLHLIRIHPTANSKVAGKDYDLCLFDVHDPVTGEKRDMGITFEYRRGTVKEFKRARKP